MVTLLPHQTKAVDDVVANGLIALVHGEAGCGKTYIAADLIKRTLDEYGGRALYVTQASSIVQQVHKLRSYGLDSSTSRDATVYVCSHERMRIDANLLKETKWSIAVVDEIHKCEAGTGKTTKALIGDHRGNAIYPRFRIGMTATPLANGLKDCYPYLRWLHPNCRWSSYTAFAKECLEPHPRVEHAYIGVYAHKFDELSRMMREITVKVDYVPSYLPPIVERIEVALSNAEREAYSKIEKDGIIELAGRPKVLLANQMSIIGKLRQFVANPASIGYDIPSTKEAALLDLLKRTEGKSIVFCNHTTILKVLSERHGWPCVMGGVTMKRRNEILESEPDVLLMSSAGEASLDCQAYSNVIHLDEPWHDGHLDQRNGRAAREGQTKQVRLYYIIARNTCDQHTDAIIRRKLRENVRVFSLCRPSQNPR
jgi:SNF2 family DNA or RNA helicase